MRYLALCLVLTACGTEGDACHRKSDCTGDLECVGPDEGPSCGIPPRQECMTDLNCPSGELCHAIADSCSASGVGSMCGVACTSTSCETGFSCSATGACEPIACDQGATCASYQRCDPTIAHDNTGPVYSHSAGCVDVTCDSDSPCPSAQACVNGFCQTTIGTCGVVSVAA